MEPCLGWPDFLLNLLSIELGGACLPSGRRPPIHPAVRYCRHPLAQTAVRLLGNEPRNARPERFQIGPKQDTKAGDGQGRQKSWLRLGTSRLGLVFLALFWAGPALAQGFAGLGGSADGFAQVKPGMALEFPRDHGAHPAFRIEWWYLTANLTGSDGRDYGVQWTLFRAALAPESPETPETAGGWADPQVWMGHAAITTPAQQLVTERLARGGIGQAGVVAAPFEAFIDEWRMAGIDPMHLQASAPDFAFDLTLRAEGPLVAQGQAGYSVKSAEGQASYYYSQPFYRVQGVLTLPDGSVQVTGQGWLDREWSSQPLAADQSGWDWLSLHFDSGEKLMGFRLRDGGGGFASATWISAAGVPEPLPPGSLRLTPLEQRRVAGRDVPVRWRLELPQKQLDITTTPVNQDAWMPTTVPYWEGPVRFSGSHSGRGYLEMTGY